MPLRSTRPESSATPGCGTAVRRCRSRSSRRAVSRKQPPCDLHHVEIEHAELEAWARSLRTAPVTKGCITATAKSRSFRENDMLNVLRAEPHQIRRECIDRNDVGSAE